MALPPTLEALVESVLLIRGDPPECDPTRVPLLRVARPEEQLRLSKQCDLWAFVWTSSSVLADVVRLMASLLGECSPPVTSLEIGAGLGLGSVSAALHGWSATATDTVPDALRLIALNADRLGVSSRLSVSQLDWHKAWAAVTPPLQPASFDVIIGADVLFLSSNARPILALLRDAWREWREHDAEDGGEGHSKRDMPARTPGVCTSRERMALLVDPGRPGRDELEALAGEYGIAVTRRDMACLPTSVALMKECTILILTPERADRAVGETADGGFLLVSALRACELIAGRCSPVPGSSDAAGSQRAPGKPAYGYTLPSVVEPAAVHSPDPESTAGEPPS
jgi:hypothetical protein